MCIDFTNINIVCSKDLYTLPDIHHLIDDSFIYHMFNFTDVYSWYNQIRMDAINTPKTTVMSNHANYYYNFMPFSLKNVGATCQRLMEVVFSQQISKNLEVHVDDMIVKTTKGPNHGEDLEDVVYSVKKYNMHLNLAKCSFRVQDGKL